MRRIHMNSVGFAALGRTIIKNNRAQRPESKRGVSFVPSRKVKTYYKKASSEVLEKIKRNMMRKQKRKRIKLVFAGIIISVVMACCFWYLTHFNYI